MSMSTYIIYNTRVGHSSGPTAWSAVRESTVWTDAADLHILLPISNSMSLMSIPAESVIGLSQNF